MKIKLLFLALLACVTACSQNLSLETALQQGTYSKLEQAQQQIVLAQMQLNIQRTKQLPLLYAEANLQRNLIVPVTPVPSIAFNPNAQAGDITPLKFATDWSAKAGLQASLDLFNPVNKLDITQAKHEITKAVLEKKITETNLKNAIISTYAQGVLAQQQLQFAIANAKVYDQAYQAVLNRFQAGRVSEYDKNQATQKHLELYYLVQEAEAVLVNQFVKLSEFVSIEALDSLVTPIDQIIQKVHIQNATDDESRLQLDQQLNEIQAKKNKLLYLPKLTLNAFYGTNFFNNTLDLTQSNYWYGNSYVNMALRIPISEGYETHLKSKKLALENQYITTQLNEAYTATQLKATQKANEVLLLHAKIEMLKNALTLSEQNYQIVLQRVLGGRTLVSELSAEFDRYLQDQKKLWQAQYDLVAKMIE